MAELKPKLDYSDLQVTPDDGRRHELVRGDLLVTPSPRLQHQRVVKRLAVLLIDFFEARSIGEVFVAPTDVILTPQDVFVPDLCVVGPATRLTERGIEGPPLLVVEVLSPSTRAGDRGIKARRYVELGVEHLWLVDPDERRVECYRSTDGTFRPVAQAGGNGAVVHPDFDGLVVELAGLW